MDQMPAQPAASTQQEARTFERLFNQIRKAKIETRQRARGTLTPAVLRKHLSSGAPLDLLYGVKRDGTPFTAEDLKHFDRRAHKIRSVFEFTQKGVRADQLIATSRAIDIERSRQQIRSATMYRIFNSKEGVLLHFRTPASDKSKYQNHQVKIRLDEWNDWLTTSLPFQKAARNLLAGRISFDCDCGRHQYWYRYVATVGGFALKPLENAYPKIRNPKLTGACCKHVLRVLATLRGPAVERMVAKELEQAAGKIGFGDDKRAANRFLTQAELKKAARSSAAMNVPSSKEAQKAFEDYLTAKKGIRKKMTEKATMTAVDKLRLERSAYKQIARAEQERRQAAERQAADLTHALTKSKLSMALTIGIYRDKLSRESVISKFAEDNSLTREQVASLAANISI